MKTCDMIGRARLRILEMYRLGNRGTPIVIWKEKKHFFWYSCAYVRMSIYLQSTSLSVLWSHEGPITMSKNLSVYIPASATGSAANILAMYALCTEDERERGRNWYQGAHEDVIGLATAHGRDFWTVAQVLSVISPQRLWSNNVRDCNNTIIAHGLATADRIPFMRSQKTAAPSGWSCFTRAWEILDGNRELVESGAPKTFNFAKTIESPSTWRGVVVDSHAAALWSDDYRGAGAYQIPYSLYKKIAKGYITAADMLEILPSGAQAATWEKRREILAMIEKSEQYMMVLRMYAAAVKEFRAK